MSFIIQLDFDSLLFLFLGPPIIIFLCFTAYELAKTVRGEFLFKMQRKYTNANIKIVEKYNKSIEENLKLQNKIIKDRKKIIDCIKIKEEELEDMDCNCCQNCLADRVLDELKEELDD